VNAANPPGKSEIADNIIDHRLANLEAAAQNCLELASNSIREITKIRQDRLADCASLSKLPSLLQINVLLDEHQIELRRLLGPNVNFELRLSPSSLPIKADADLLRALFSELAINAHDAMDSSATRQFRVTTGRNLGEVVVRIADTGCGMDSKTKSKILAGEEFTTKPGVHSGKGMTHIRQILAGFGARMEIKSTLGAGTTFVLYFQPAGSPAAPKHD